MRWRVVMASFSFSMRLRSFARSRSTCCGEGVLGWWMRQAGSEQTLTTCPRLPPSMTMASAIFSHGFWLADSLVLAPFAFGFLISNSTYRFRPKGAPSREFHAAEIWISSGLVSTVFFTQASILARKQSGEVHYVELGVKGELEEDSVSREVGTKDPPLKSHATLEVVSALRQAVLLVPV